MEHRDESQEETSLQRQQISRHRGRRQDHLELREKSNHLLARRRGRFRLLHTGRQGQGHYSFRSGKEAVVAIHGKGDFFGEGCLNGQPLRLASAVAMADSAIMRFTKAAIVRVLRGQPKFAEKFMSHLLARNARVEEDLVDQLLNSSEKRLARALLLMANFGKEESPEPVIAKVSQAMLAELVGTTRARVSTFMNKFRKLGFVEYNGDMKVHPSLLNVVLHN